MSEFATTCNEAQASSLEASVLEPCPLEPSLVSDDLRERLYQFLLPLLTMLDCLIDVRLVRTFWQSVETILLFRNRAHGLLLSELGGYLLSPEHAPAGTKRLSNLLRCDKWASDLVGDYLWKQAAKRQEQLQTQGKDALVLWDESVNEKPESRKVEGLCPVRSSKAKRLARSRPGFPARPVFVNGFHWMGLLLIGMSGSPTVAFMQWFTTRAKTETAKTETAKTETAKTETAKTETAKTETAKTETETTDLISVRHALLKKCWAAWQNRVLHLFDRGYASAKWIEACVEFKLRFVMRWPKRFKLLNIDGEEKHAWQLFQGKTPWDERMVWDTVQNKPRRLAILATLVEHPELPNVALWLVCARPGDGKEPWYLLTTEAVRNVDEAFRIVLAYARRWQIEMAFRFGKSELAMESPRLWTLERRTKMLMLVTLTYAFLLSLLDDSLGVLRTWILDKYCHRTGKRCREARAPLYRLRMAISRLWQQFPEFPETRVLHKNKAAIKPQNSG